MCSTMENDNNEYITFAELQTIKKSYYGVTKGDVSPEKDIPEFSEITCEETKIEEKLFINDDDYIGENISSVSDFQDRKTPKKKKKKLLKALKRELKLHKSIKKLAAAASLNKKAKKKLKKRGRKPGPKSNEPKQPAEKKVKCQYPRLCPGCGHAYRTKQSFWNHKQRCPMLPENRMRNALDENGIPIEDGEAGPLMTRKEYICAHCDRHYRKKYNLQMHLNGTCPGKPTNKGRLQCWEPGCQLAFYKYVDLIHHLSLRHGQDLQVQKLQFPNLNAFNSWKTEESNNKFMYARKITGCKRFSNTKYHYFVCQFNHRNEKKNGNRKTNRRKNNSLVVPNYNCPSRIMVKEVDNQVHVTYISSHNHELNLSNVKYQPLEKETRSYIKTLLQLGVSAQKIKDHLQQGVGNPEIDSFLTTKQHFLTLNRIKRMESKLKAKNRVRPPDQALAEKDTKNVNLDNDYVEHDDSYAPCDDMMDPAGTSASYTCTSSPKSAAPRKEPDERIRSIENNLKKLKGYMNKSNVKEKLSDRISKMIQELCDECENVEVVSSVNRPTVPKKPRASNTSRKRKQTTLPAAPTTAPASAPVPALAPVSAPAPAPALAPVTPVLITPATTVPPQIIQPVMIQHQPQIQTHQLQQLQPMETLNQSRIVNTVINNVSNVIVMRNEKSFTPPIDETFDLLKPHFQPFNVNLLGLKSLDRYIPERELLLLKTVDERFGVGLLYDSIVNSFLNLICQPLGNVITADTNITEYVQLNQKVPDVWHCFNWPDIDTIFIPCNPTKKHWFLLVLLVKQSELQVLDPSSGFESISNIYKKYANSINCWYNVLRNFLGIVQCNVTAPPHAAESDPANSGVLVCWYVFQYINKGNLADNVDLEAFRQHMFNTIVNDSSRAV